MVESQPEDGPGVLNHCQEAEHSGCQQTKLGGILPVHVPPCTLFPDSVVLLSRADLAVFAELARPSHLLEDFEKFQTLERVPSS